MIDVRKVTKSFRSGSRWVEALRGLSCRIERGRFAFIVGPSGSGKSTLLYLMGSLDRPDSGQILVDGRDLVRMSEAEQNAYRRDRVGFIFQSFNLISNLTALENVLVPFLPRGVTAQQRRRAADLLAEVGLGDRIDHRPYQLSGGEQQRVAIARALINDPALILADEPTGNLDDESAHRIIELLENACRQHGKTLILVAHERGLSRQVDRIFELRAGSLQKTQGPKACISQ